MSQRCGHVAILGAPNAGKSTLTNALVGQKVAIVSPKAQTTRTRLMGIALEGDAQIILVDTPGIFAPNRRLDRAMVAAAWEGASDADLILMVVDGRGGAGPKVEKILEGLVHRPERKWLVLNKVDIAAKEKLLALTEKLLGMCPFEQVYYVSAATSDGLAELKTAIAGVMPEGQWHFPEDQVSDASERLAAAEITREQLYLQLHDELPYASTVETEKYSERADGSVEIYQQIFVERESQRAIVLGKGGSRIKAIGAAARKEISELMGVTVHLYLHIKVKAGWDEDRGVYRDMGLDWVD
ncbi:Era GTPase [Sphingomonadaceae bacterium]|jgi:GTP-binding protein Era|uniref:GTPase Era n=1 Tax=Sphingorhabdus sp. TaxID=1902408 RepID=UPI00323FD4BA